MNKASVIKMLDSDGELIARLSIKVKAGNILRIRNQLYRIDALRSKERICYAYSIHKD
ncbi:hypothetical protein [Paenibacillus chitinolyticus]|uniref:Uncharacterized protein n=1 Tax=Paenibacillus chitinolyticus TaxID=79263 RepID=A0ABT4FIG6_9BACL|nr:hypothetical protein [Paenibacillus chitinolyticus]MCY9589704.1 hypothetical protein [Paenibacillus chitinolyticus]MCY9598295.1 hypothetical protein [Paenibacillus chitinolyticus]